MPPEPGNEQTSRTSQGDLTISFRPLAIHETTRDLGARTKGLQTALLSAAHSNHTTDGVTSVVVLGWWCTVGNVGVDRLCHSGRTPKPPRLEFCFFVVCTQSARRASADFVNVILEAIRLLPQGAINHALPGHCGLSCAEVVMEILEAMNTISPSAFNTSLWSGLSKFFCHKVVQKLCWPEMNSFGTGHAKTMSRQVTDQLRYVGLHRSSHPRFTALSLVVEFIAPAVA